MGMSAATKFLFDTDFGGSEGKPAEPAIALAERALKLAEAEAAAHRRGYAEAQADAKPNPIAASPRALDHIAAALAAANGALQAIETRLECEAVEVAVAVARKLAPALIAREPFAEIAALASDCFQSSDLLAACRGAGQRCALRRRQREARRHRAGAQVSKAGWSCWPRPTLRSAIAASNGRTAESTATAPPPNSAIGEAVAGYVSARRVLAALQPRHATQAMHEILRPRE